MNVAVLSGRLTAGPIVKYTQAAEPMAFLRFTLAVDRKKKDKEADFISCTAFGKTAENIGKFFEKGSLIFIKGHIQTGSYQKPDGTKVYTTDVIVDEWDLTGEKKKEASQRPTEPEVLNEVFMSIPDGDDAGLPFV